MDAKNMEQSQSRQPNYVTYSLVGTGCLAAVWGIVIVLGAYNGVDIAGNVAHFPFWLMLGAVGVLLNYIPIAKSKPIVIPIAGVLMTVVTVAWFCFDNFIELNGFGEFLGRVRLDMALLVGCYCLTHMSLLMLAYRRGGDNILLAITCLAVALSGLGYFVTLSGFAEFEAFFFVLAAIVCLFFTKFALTIAVIVASINSSTLDSRAYIAPVKPVHKLE